VAGVPSDGAKVSSNCADRRGVTPCSAPPFALRATPDDIVRQLRHLPSAPRVLPKLKRLLSDGNSSIHEIVALVRLDPGIAARVLQVGNSAFFSQGLRCYTVDEAVHRVGYDQIYELVSTAVASQVLVQPLAAYGMEADELWQSSVACAIACECLAERLNIDRDIAYTVGLLHRVGLVAINEWLERTEPGVRFTSVGLPLETCEHERRVLGFHNAEAGAALLRLWEFPAVMAEPVRWQYLPNATAAHVQLATLLHLAKWVRTLAGDQSARVPVPEPAALRRVSVSLSQLQHVVTEVHDRVRAVGELLEDHASQRAAIRFPAGERLIVA
jgi:HD-like signal output (HDOD) protein